MPFDINSPHDPIRDPSRLQHRFGHGRPARALGAIGARRFAVVVAVLVLVPLLLIAYRNATDEPPDAQQAASPAMTITTGISERQIWPSTVLISGAVLPWQEAIVGAPLNGLRLSSIDVDVGDRVVKGQILARFDDALILAEVHRLEALLMQARAVASQARREAERAELLRPSGALSEQSILAVTTQAEVADAAVRSARAALHAKRVEHSYTLLRASDDGVISSRTATVGAVPETGEELFKLIRQQRLEWRGQAPAQRLAGIRKGQTVSLKLPDGASANATVRLVAPALDEASRSALVYADIIPPSTARAGMYAKGTIHTGESAAIVVPASAVSERDGRSSIFVVRMSGRRTLVNAVAIQTGRRQGGFVEVVAGIDAGTHVAVEGAGFLTDGDLVSIVEHAQGMEMPKKAIGG
jgi:RND family efflux transporter MFP subunit